jgi:hypothetical protein
MGAAEEADYTIKPENATPTIPMSEFPLLLKNYDKRKVYLCDGWNITLTVDLQFLYEQIISHLSLLAVPP